MKALFLNPYLNTLGGGEKYMLDISYVLHTLGYDIYFVWNDTTLKEEIIDRFGDKYRYINMYTKWHSYSPINRALESRTFDVVFYQPDGSYPLSLAKKNFALLQVPNLDLVQPTSILQRLKKKRWNPIFNSHFVKRFFIKNDRAINGPVVYPAISDTFFSSPTKKKHIVSVGRFFQHLHAKKQETLIKAYIFACEKYPQFNKYTLFLVGTSLPQDEQYVRYLRKISSRHSNIHIETNYTYQQLQKLYSETQFYWHATGYGESETKNPQKMEHFGISTVEASAAGAVPVVIGLGGQKEIVKNGVNGLLWTTKAELFENTLNLINNPAKLEQLSKRAVQNSKRFSEEVFFKEYEKIFLS